MKLNLRKNHGYFTPAGTVVLLALWIAFLLGMWYVASKIIDWLNRMFPQPPPICQPTNIVDNVTSPGVWIRTDEMLAGITLPPSSATPTQSQSTHSLHSYTVSRSEDLNTWMPVLEVSCYTNEIRPVLETLTADEATFWPTNCGFYRAIEMISPTNSTNDPKDTSRD